jgi:hypothetical protein
VTGAVRIADLGPPVAWRALAEGTPVFDSRGERVGVVEDVLTAGDIFEGLLIHTRPLPGRHLIADHDQIAAIRERGVALSVGREELHAPGPRRHDRGAAAPEPRWHAALRRAWDRVSGWRPGS